MTDKINLGSLEEVKKISVCKPYKGYTICVYCAGHHAHQMYWAYVLFKDEKLVDRDRLNNCLAVDDGFKELESLIDFWEAEITYEEICSWRNICEWMNRHCTHATTKTILYHCKIYDKRLIAIVGQKRRQLLWDKYKIQLIKWDRDSKQGGWQLKGNWEDKIHFLEQVYILGRNPDELPRPWLTKWEAKQKQNEKDWATNELKKSMNSLIAPLELMERLVDPFWGEIEPDRKLERINHELSRLRNNISKAHKTLQRYKQVFELE